MSPFRLCLVRFLGITVLTSLVPQVHALELEIDYRYDTNKFFEPEGNPQGAAGAAAARAALSAAAARFGAIIDQKLLPAKFDDDGDDPRIRFADPGNGKVIEVSSAKNASSDALLPGGARVAAEYRGPWEIQADTYVIYAGAYVFEGEVGEEADGAGTSSTGIGENFNDVFDDPLGPFNRGFTHPFPNGPRENLPVWGGSVAFNSDTEIKWHFDHTKAAGRGETDFYTIALHEIAHVLGINTREWNNWQGYIEGLFYLGPEGIKALEEDNGGVAKPEIVDGAHDPHWWAETAMSKIFPAGLPNYVGTVGSDVNQDSVMYGVLEFFFPDQVRFEVTNLDVGCLRDVGWSTISGDVVNQQPIAKDAGGSVLESSPAGTEVVTVDALDPDAGDTLSYTITAGNAGNLFSIDNTGAITTNGALDFESATSFSLTVRVQDTGGLTDTATVTINVINVNEPPVVLPLLATVIAEDIAVGDLVATVSTSDPDSGDTPSFAITSGNTGNAFAIGDDGRVTVAAPLDDEEVAAYSLTVTVTDSGDLSTNTTLEIAVTNVPDPVDAGTISLGIAMPPAPGEALSLSWKTEPGVSYTVMTSIDLKEWQAVVPSIVAVGNSASWEEGQAGFTDPNLPADQTQTKYYRIVVGEIPVAPGDPGVPGVE